MIEILKELLVLAEQGRLDLENVRLNDRGHSIEIGSNTQPFEGEITFEVTLDTDVIEFGHMLKQAIERGNNETSK